MSNRMIVLSAVAAVFWILGLIDQLVAGQSVMRYLALSAALIAIAVWRWQPQQNRTPEESAPESERTPPRE